MKRWSLLYFGLAYILIHDLKFTEAKYACRMTGKVDIVLVVGDTQSTLRSNWRNHVIAPGLSSFIINFLRQFDYRMVRMGIMAFSDTARLIAPISNNPIMLRQQLMWWRPEFRGTKTYRALYSARRYFKSKSSTHCRKIVVLVTDSCSDNKQLTIQQARLARAEGISIITIGFSKRVDASEMIAISGTSDYSIWAVNDLLLTSTIPKIIYAICKAIKTITTVLPDPTTSHTTTVPTTTSPTTMIPTTMQDKKADFILIMDDSESTRQFSNLATAYNEDLKYFVKRLAMNMNLDICRLGIVMVSDTARTIVRLGADIESIYSSIDTFTPEFDRTRSSAGYELANEMLSSDSDETRKQFVMLVSDGVPLDNTDINREASILKEQGTTLGFLQFDTKHGIVCTDADFEAILQNSTWKFAVHRNGQWNKQAEEIAHFVCSG